MAIQLTTLGALRAFRDGVELERLAGKRLRAALLVYLAIERRVARESLLTVFWPESSSDNARHALRQCLYHLRSELGADWLEVNAQEVRALVRTDVDEFVAAIERGEPETAARLYGGPFLAGINLVDVLPWENWVDARRTQYARAFRKACREWVNARHARGDLQGAIEAAQLWVAPDPLDDEAQHHLILALTSAGERTAAIRQFETYERLLQAEDLHALDETIALIERIRGEPPAPPSLTSYTEANPPQRPLAAVSAAPRRKTSYRAIAAGVTALLLVAGAWGVNLTRARTAELSAKDIAVLPFSVRGTGDATYLREGMVNLVATALDGASVRPVDARAVLAMVAQNDGRAPGLERGSRVATQLGAGLFVLGDVVEAGDSLRIEAAIYHADADKRPLSRASVSGRADHVFGLVDKLAAQLLAGLGAAPADRLTRTAAVTTASLLAFKAYLDGEAEMRAGQFERAEEAYLRAIADDSTFAVAHYRLALALDWGARGDSEAAARAAARHADRLTPRDRALLDALLVYMTGDGADAERRYRAILARYPDDLDAWLQLAETLSHYGPVRGRSTSETEQAWRRVLSYEPKNVSAIVHMARIAVAEGRTTTIDSLLARFTPAELTMDRRLLQVSALRAIALRDTAAVRSFVRVARGWEDAAVWQFAAYLTAFSPEPAIARQAIQPLIEPTRSAGVIADLHWYVALLHLENGQLAAARAAMASARAANARVPAQWQRRAFVNLNEWWISSLPLPFPDTMLQRIRLSAATADVSQWRVPANFDPGTDDTYPFRLVLMRHSFDVPNRWEALRLYVIGAISLRLNDAGGASTASLALSRLAADPASDWFTRSLDAELRARRALHEGRPADALRMLDEAEFGAVSVGPNGVVPFMVHPQRRFFRGELLAALGRDAEALSWFASLAVLSVPESPFRALAHGKQAEIYERLGNRSEAALHYARFGELWQDADLEIRNAQRRNRIPGHSK